jgi:peptide/nickel transport system permease protein
MRQLFRRRIVMGATIALVLVVWSRCLPAPLSGFDPNETAVSQALARPSAGHIMGTDELGRDLFTRIAFGGRYSLTIALLTALGSMVAGTSVRH